MPTMHVLPLLDELDLVGSSPARLPAQWRNVVMCQRGIAERRHGGRGTWWSGGWRVSWVGLAFPSSLSTAAMSTAATNCKMVGNIVLFGNIQHTSLSSHLHSIKT